MILLAHFFLIDKSFVINLFDSSNAYLCEILLKCDSYPWKGFNIMHLMEYSTGKKKTKKKKKNICASSHKAMAGRSVLISAPKDSFHIIKNRQYSLLFFFVFRCC